MNEKFLTKTFKQKDIEAFIKTQSEESINLEFKRGDALVINDEKSKKELAKDVSAFANSDGGIIIYGIEEKNHKASNLAFVDGGLITKEWLEQVINSRIQRKINGLRIDPIRYNKKTESSIFVVKIPRSSDAPHMTSDKRFYKRYNFQSVEMEEYEVRNLYFRKEKTELEIAEPQITLNYGAIVGGRPMNFRANLQIDIVNMGPAIEMLYKVEIRLPNNLTGAIHAHGIDPYLRRYVRNEDGYALYSVPNISPLFQGEISTLDLIRINLDSQNFNDIQNSPIRIRLLYSNSTIEKSILLYDHLRYNGEKLTPDLLRSVN